MDAIFWMSKWDKDEIGFHLHDAHPLLQKFYPIIFSTDRVADHSFNNAVFVPLCGKSKDMLFLAERESKVIGCELSEKAVIAFFTENKIPVQKTNGDSANTYTSEKIDIICGDFFSLTRENLNGVSFIYDRAALVALPLEMRGDYVKQLLQLLPKGEMLLICIEYPQSQMDGPPFSVTQNEVELLFQPAAVKPIYRQNILSEEPKFAARGVSYFYEAAYHIKW